MEIILKKPAIREAYQLLANSFNHVVGLFDFGSLAYNVNSEKQPVFIIGAPRTGSTILYQILTNELDVLYIDNLIDIFHKNISLGFRLSTKFFEGKAHNCFTSREGDTWSCGLHAPSESGEFWYQYLPRNKHYIDEPDINDKLVNDFQKQIFPVIEKFEKPFLFKNLNVGQRLKLIKRIAPNAKFIYVRRNFIDTAFSILNSRRKLRVEKSEWWSIKPKGYEEKFGENEFELITNQIFYLEKQIAEDLHLFDSGNFITLFYDEIYKNFNDVIKKVSDFIGTKQAFRPNKIEPILKERKAIQRNIEEEKLFLNYSNKFNWDETKI